jgi:hypothetical protein
MEKRIIWLFLRYSDFILFTGVCVCVCVGGEVEVITRQLKLCSASVPIRTAPQFTQSLSVWFSELTTLSPVSVCLSVCLSPQVTLQYTVSTKTLPPKAVNCRHFMQPASSLPCSQQPGALLYPDPDQFRPRLLILFIYKPFQYYPFLYT